MWRKFWSFCLSPIVLNLLKLLANELHWKMCVITYICIQYEESQVPQKWLKGVHPKLYSPWVVPNLYEFFLLLSIKEDIVKNPGNQIVDGSHWLSYIKEEKKHNGRQWLPSTWRTHFFFGWTITLSCSKSQNYVTKPRLKRIMSRSGALVWTNISLIANEDMFYVLRTSREQKPQK